METFITSDMDLIINLLILGHTPEKVDAIDGLVKYTFTSAEIARDLERLSKNEDIMVNLKNVWAAQKIWSMNRSRAKGR